MKALIIAAAMAGLAFNAASAAPLPEAKPTTPGSRKHMRKPHHPAFAPSPTLVPLQAAIRSSCVHGGLDSIDLDQALAYTLGAIYASGLDTDMMARERRNSLWWRHSGGDVLVATFDPRFTPAQSA